MHNLQSGCYCVPNKAVLLCAQKIKEHDNVHKLYQQQLLREGVLKDEDLKRMADHIGGACCCSPLVYYALAQQHYMPD